jgi:hypothetical protein
MKNAYKCDTLINRCKYTDKSKTIRAILVCKHIAIRTWSVSLHASSWTRRHRTLYFATCTIIEMLANDKHQ